MRFYSFERDNKQITDEVDNSNETGFIVDLFEKTLINNDNIKNGVYYMDNDYSCRMDTICSFLYDGDTSYVEELLVLNNIVNPFAVEKDSYILYVKNIEKFANMYASDYNKQDGNKFKILNINKNKTSSNVQLPPSVNPGLNQIDVDYNKKKITVLNKFK